MRVFNICKFPASVQLDSLHVSCFVLEADPKVMVQPHLLGKNRMLLVTQGKATFSFDRTRLRLSAGSLVFGFRNETLCVADPEDCRYMYVDFDGFRGAELLRRFDIRQGNRQFDGYDSLIPLWQESLSRAWEQTVDLAAESMLLYTLSRISSGNTQSGLIGKMLEITEQSFTDAELSLTTIAQELNYNAKYLSHYFKEKMGLTYSEYLRTLRIRYAANLFDHGIDSVKNVAFLSGFTDPLYFSSVFKKATGLSPKEYKSSLQEK